MRGAKYPPHRGPFCVGYICKALRTDHCFLSNCIVCRRISGFHQTDPIKHPITHHNILSSIPEIPGTSGPRQFLFSQCPHGQLHAFAPGNAQDYPVRPGSSPAAVHTPSTDSTRCCVCPRSTMLAHLDSPSLTTCVHFVVRLLLRKRWHANEQALLLSRISRARTD